MSDIITNITKFNEGRIPEFLDLKYKLMADNPFRFYRGTAHLFAYDFPFKSSLGKSPLTWLCGDLHLENFGSYKAGNRLVYFDMNDFDESCLGPCLYDPARLMVSIMLAVDSLQTNRNAAVELCRSIIEIYAETLASGHPEMVEEASSHGLIRIFLDQIESRTRKELLDKRTILKGRKRKLLIQPEKNHFFEMKKEDQEKVIFMFEKWAEKQPNPSFFRVEDVAYRASGTGSLGLTRYVLLVEGKGVPDHYFMLDLKEACPSCIVPYIKEVKQPIWNNEADRLVSIQKRLQSMSPALLSSLEMDGKPFVVKELQPTKDKMDFALCKGKLTLLDEVIRMYARIIAWNQIRSGGRQGSATTDTLIEFSNQTSWKSDLLDFSIHYSQKVKTDYLEFVESRKTIN